MGNDLGRRLYVFELPGSALMPRNEPTRSLEHPQGNEAIPTVAESNRFTARVVAVARLLAARGAGVVIMAPLFATVWGMTAMRELLSEWGNSFVRFDYCMDGRAHNREMAVWTTLPMDDFGQVCAHPHPHPEGLPARKVRRAAPPTPSVVYAVLEAAVPQSFNAVRHPPAN